MKPVRSKITRASWVISLSIFFLLSVLSFLLLHFFEDFLSSQAAASGLVLQPAVLDQLRSNFFWYAGSASLLTMLLLMYLMWQIMHRLVLLPMRRSERELSDLASTDALTGLYNRRYFTETCSDTIERLRQAGKPLSMAMLDLDHFKAFNDEFGHAIGDLVLILFSHEVKLQIRNSDILGRVGGEEFAICMPGLAIDEARQVGERIVETVRRLPNLQGESNRGITVSIGITEMSETDSFDALLKRADECMYRAKQAGRDRVVTDAD